MAKLEDFAKPPEFRPDIDFQEWRKSVAVWVTTLKRANDKGNNRELSTCFMIPSDVFLQEAIPRDHRALIEEAISSGTINTDDDDPIAPVVAMVNILAVDGPNAQVSRLISTHKNVVSCIRQKNEKLVVFASRLCDLAGKHLRQTGTSSASQTGQMLAITLLNNAKLDDVTLINAKMQLVRLAKDREAKEEEEAKFVPFKSVEDIAKVYVKMQSVINRLPAFEEMSMQEAQRFIRGMTVQHHHLGTAINEAANPPTAELTEAKKIEERFADPVKVVKLNLDDAVTVLRNISHGSETNMTVIHDELNSMVNAKFNSLLAQHKKAGAPGPSGGGGGSGSSKSGSGRRKARSVRSRPNLSQVAQAEPKSRRSSASGSKTSSRMPRNAASTAVSLGTPVEIRSARILHTPRA